MSLKVLMISSDRKVSEEGGAVLERVKEYGELVEELHIVLLSDSNHGLKEKQLARNVWVYPTNSLFNLLRPIDAVRMGKKIVLNKKFVRGQSLITAQDPFECGWAGLRIKKLWRLPLEIQLHTNPFSPYFNGFQNTVRKFFMKKALRKADTLRVVSRVAGEEAISKFSLDKNKVFVLPIYVDQKRIEDAPITFDLHARYGWHFIILIASRLTPEKNLPLALEALSLVRTKFPDVGMVIAGSGPEESRLKALTKKLQLESAVEFVGWQNDLTSFYKTANVFLQTSFFEGHQLSLVEAGLSGLPVVTTPAGLASELTHGKDAYIYSLDDAKGKRAAELFAEGLIDLIENNYKRENLRSNLKYTLQQILLSKEEYLKELKLSWERAATQVR